MQFAEMLKERRDFIDGVVENLDFDIHSILKIPSKYALLTGGKRLRPFICMLCAEVVGGDYRKTKDAFLALELIHNGTLVHDDIIDEDLFRRGKPAAYVKFGGKKAVLTGDVLLSLGLKYATKTDKLSIVRWLSDSALKMAQGIALQTYYRKKTASVSSYMNIAYLKSGSLFEAAAALGSLVGCESLETAKKFAEFGKNFGIAYQIRDDICGVFFEEKMEQSRSDLLNGDLTLPFIYAIESQSMSIQDRKNLMDAFLGQKERIDNEDVQRIYVHTGALDSSLEKMKYYAENGRKSLEEFVQNEAGECIQYLIDQYYKHFNPKKKLEIIV